MRLSVPFRSLLIGLCLIALSGCNAPSGDALMSAPAPAPLPSAQLAEVNALAATVCTSLHKLAAQRRGECCGTAPAADVSAVCSGMLGEALMRGALTVDPAAAAQCGQDMAKQLQGCDWVGALPPMPPLSCRSLVTGRLPIGERCDTSLACNDGLYCQGAGPGVSGVCARPAAAGARCDIPSDNVSVLLHAKDDPRHPSCDGSCVRGQCLARQDEGGSCASSAMCRDGLNCIEGTCSTAPLAASGATCSATLPCAEGLVCSDGTCASPGGTDATCTLPFECRSLACIKQEGEAQGRCADVCLTPTAVSALPGVTPQRPLWASR